ncbi:TPA: hypothetical protein ACU16Q_000271 [Pasteurella multocida]|uniref:hypothetical protein n=1 Tax=Pasteurella multocida TaxID=747 RepID=UPI0018985484|nr:hypothetical protein [Pasteurella multocida]MBF6982041.1 hypothetical protein [Pasteurella multocida]
MRTLTTEAKEKLAQVMNTDEFIGRDYLLAVYAYAILATSRKNELRASDLDAMNSQYLAEVYNGDFDTRQANRERFPSIANSCLYETQEAMNSIPLANRITWLFDAVEELAQNLDNISNARFLKAVRNAEIAQEEIEAAIEALENAALIEEAEKTAQTAKIIGLPALKGTPKQIEWAERIRKRCIETMSEKDLGRGLKSENASYWINKYKHVLPAKK